jgi:hypothetical protein
MSSPSSRRLWRATAVFTALTTFLSATATGLAAIGSDINAALPRHIPQFTHAPKAPFLGAKPSRDPKGRGGVWSQEALAGIDANVHENLFAMTGGMFYLAHTLAVAAEPGSTYAWEASAPTASGSVNTGNGNKLTALNLLSWKTRGGGSLDFTLFHNSQPTIQTSSAMDGLGLTIST